eukprot:15420-Heterococcus_DN1.PRE.2
MRSELSSILRNGQLSQPVSVNCVVVLTRVQRLQARSAFSVPGVCAMPPEPSVSMVSYASMDQQEAQRDAETLP